MEITVGVFRGLLTSEGKVRLQMRKERGSVLGQNVSYLGDFELPGGRVEVVLKEALTLPVLLAESARETQEELGILVGNPPSPVLYFAVFKAPGDAAKEDWAFVIPTPPFCWDERAKMAYKTVDVDADQLKVLGDLSLVVSGTGKRMWSMAMVSLLFSNEGWICQRARGHLVAHRPNWEAELFHEPEASLAKLRASLGLT